MYEKQFRYPVKNISLCTVFGFFDLARITESGCVTVEMNADNPVIETLMIIIIRRRKK